MITNNNLNEEKQLTVSDTEWEIAEKFFNENPNETKLKREQPYEFLGVVQLPTTLEKNKIYISYEQSDHSIAYSLIAPNGEEVKKIPIKLEDINDPNGNPVAIWFTFMSPVVNKLRLQRESKLLDLLIKNQHIDSKHSFIKVDDIIYALEKRGYVGDGTYGKVKVAEPRTAKEGKALAVKITKEEEANEGKILTILERLIGKAQSKSNDKFYTLMPIVGNKTLHDNIYELVTKKEVKTFPLTTEQKLEFALGTALAIKSLHEDRIIHNDIKPENFMINSNNNVIAIDFGSSIHLNEDQSYLFSKEKKYGVTPNYQAPETYKLSSNEFSNAKEFSNTFSFASDVYSLGELFRNDLAIDNDFIICMQADKPENRPSLDQVIDHLKVLLNKAKLNEKMDGLLIESREKIYDRSSNLQQKIEDIQQENSIRQHSVNQFNFFSPHKGRENKQEKEIENKQESVNLKKK